MYEALVLPNFKGGAMHRDHVKVVRLANGVSVTLVFNFSRGVNVAAPINKMYEI